MAMSNKWTTTAASIWIQSTSGSLYTFSFYSPSLKTSQHYTQSTLDTISVFKDFGANIGILSGLLYTAVARKRFGGPWVVLLVGAVQCFVGYFMMWVCVSGAFGGVEVPVWVMCLFMLLAAHGVTFLNTANVVTGVLNFRRHSGTIVGIMKGFLGLSGAILLQVYQTVFNAGPPSYILMLALLPFLNTLLFMSSVKAYQANEINEKKYLNALSLISIIVAAYLFSIIIIEQVVTLNIPARVVVFLVLVILLASPLYVAVTARSTENLVETNQLLNDISDNQDSLEEEVEDDKNLVQAIRTVNFWCLFLTTAAGMGTGLATINNLAQVGESLGYTTFETSTLVSLWSIWNFVGRFGAGYVSDHILYTKKWARPVFIAITLGLMSVGHCVIASGFPGALYVGSVLLGIFYGSQWSLMPTIVSEIFGVSHFGTIFNTITIAGPVGSYFFSVRVIGYLYDREVARGGTDYCVGTHCFRSSFLIMAFTTFVGFTIALWLFVRTRRFYEQIVLKRDRGSS